MLAPASRCHPYRPGHASPSLHRRFDLHMSDSLRDQLLGLGFKPAPKPANKPQAKQGSRPGSNAVPNKPGSPPAPKQGRDPRREGPARGPSPQRPAHPAAARGPRRSGSGAEMDLAKAYAIRAQKEKQERIETERQKQEAARLRREARQKLAEALKDKALNVADADIARHFPYGGKIKRVHVTADQLRALNAGELGVVQMDGRYVLVDAATLDLAASIFADAVALRVDPDAPAQDDPYADPQYQVPDDLVW
jgi:uncharacterized protein YaiL (DUF2058 family)